jgi:Uma2 family endonuclease
MASTPTRLMTVEEFRQLPEDKGPVYHELRHGEIVAVTRPKLKHSLIQGRLRDFFRTIAEPGSYVEIEMAFRPLPEYELWVADVAYLCAERFRNTDPDDNVCGAPEIVVEVLSPSNTAAEIMDKEQICLSNGAQEFWVIDPKKQRVRSSTSHGSTKTYERGQAIPLPLFGNVTLPVNDIFD